MKIKNILLTNDDGYQSAGLRVLINLLKNDYNLKVCTVKNQQTGVGGKLDIYGSFNWDKTFIDGVEVVYVDSSPTSAMEFASGYFKYKFDLVISGINMGINPGAVIFNSGTFAGAFWAVSIPIADKALVLSQIQPESKWNAVGFSDKEYQQMIDFPGNKIIQLLNLADKYDFWKSKILNISIPKKETNSVVITKPMPYLNWYYKCPSTEIDYKNKKYIFKNDYFNFHDKGTEYDFSAVENGFISITPMKSDMLNENAFAKIKTKKISLKD